MKQLSSKKAVSPFELAVVAFLAICAILAVVQGLGMLGASLAASEHSAPVR
ncbi:hypothetical protein P6144_00915 [Sphingomonas sp. HITSZ_GF]|uniref:hypothetical protein n=1 Tax=Sphingomonas sp. HITSZ_GF TaxID=3037247 RepID=UPI00240DD4DA|nr:hypothetical protein [Sphingomonas sp. HITSZ_GF]MDG2532196.1 hypothetical protein [Sphingomonas sp. HITSZ_GF]